MNPATLGRQQGCGVALKDTAIAVIALVGFVFGGALIAGSAGVWVGIVLGLILIVLVVVGSFAKIGDTKLRCHDCGLEWWEQEPPEF